MSSLMLFTDGSVNPKSHIGYGAYLTASDTTESVTLLAENLHVKRFENTSSTTLELQTLLWALDNITAANNAMTLIVYTDSQNIMGLPGRRQQLENNNYYSSKGKRLNNYELYQQFFIAIDQLNCQFIKVIGHQSGHQKDKVHQIFTLVDRASRQALRQFDTVSTNKCDNEQ